MRLFGAAVHQLRLFLIALQFLTRVPIPSRVGFDQAWLNRCVRYFPAIGALVGLTGAAVLVLSERVWPVWVASILAIGWTVWLTGAFHEDGLADTFDALGGSVSRERALAIMKDSRIGTYAAVALVLLLGLRIALLTSLSTSDVWRAAVALVASHVLGRAAAVTTSALLPYAGDAAHAKAKPLATSVAWSDALIAWLVTALLLAAITAVSPSNALLGAAITAFATSLLLGRWLRGRLGGFTGDTLGAVEQLSEAMVLLVFAARLP